MTTKPRTYVYDGINRNLAGHVIKFCLTSVSVSDKLLIRFLTGPAVGKELWVEEHEIRIES